MADHELEVELRRRVDEVEALTLEVRHLRADLRVKDEYIAVLQRDPPPTEAAVMSAQRYLAIRARALRVLDAHPFALRLARAAVRQLRRVS